MHLRCFCLPHNCFLSSVLFIRSVLLAPLQRYITIKDIKITRLFSVASSSIVAISLAYSFICIVLVYAYYSYSYKLKLIYIYIYIYIYIICIHMYNIVIEHSYVQDMSPVSCNALIVKLNKTVNK